MTTPSVGQNVERRSGEESPALPVCWLCRKPIEGEVCYQAGRQEFPSHREHLVTIGQGKEADHEQ